MGVKVVNCNEKKAVCEKDFPKLMKNKITGSIAIFSKDVDGGAGDMTMLFAGKGSLRKTGQKSPSRSCIMQDWEDYNEPLTLQNE